MSRPFLAAACVAAGMVTMAAQAPEPPPNGVTLSNRTMSLTIEGPGTRDAYRGTRFDWTGVITSLDVGGHRYYQPWFNRRGDVRDFVWEGEEIVVGPASGVTGPAEEFQTPLGYDEAPPGGAFIKIGVGVLRKPDATNYSAFRIYDIVDAGARTLNTTPGSATFTHTLMAPDLGYGYAYEKTISLAPTAPEMTIAHRLKNTGAKAIRTRVYNHNFLVLDGKPVGEGLSITLPFDIATTRPPDPTRARIQGKRIEYVGELPSRQTVSFPITGFGTTAADSRITVEHSGVGAGVHIEGDRPLESLALWSIRSNVSIEPFVAVAIEPGAEFTWQWKYQYYVR